MNFYNLGSYIGENLSYNFWMILLLIVPMILGLIVQLALKATYSKYSKVRSETGLTGAAAARAILDGAGLRHVPIERVTGDLTDHFDPSANVLRLSEGVYDSPSVAAIGVAAHECGHAIQYSENYAPMKLRGALVKVTNFSSSASSVLVLLGLIFSISFLAWIGLGLFCVVAFFQLVTLPVEFDASRRAVKILGGRMQPRELSGVKKVLTAAAMTYVASFLTAVFQILRILLILRGGRSRK